MAMPPAPTLVPTPPAAEATPPRQSPSSRTTAIPSRRGPSSYADFAKGIGLLEGTPLVPALLALGATPPRVLLLDLRCRMPMPTPPTARCTAPRQTPDLPRAGCLLRTWAVAPRLLPWDILQCRPAPPYALVGPPPRAQFVYIARGATMTSCMTASPPPPMRRRLGPSMVPSAAPPHRPRVLEPTPRRPRALPATFGWLFPRRLFAGLLLSRSTARRRLYPDGGCAASNAPWGNVADALTAPRALNMLIPQWPLTRHPHTLLLATGGSHLPDH